MRIVRPDTSHVAPLSPGARLVVAAFLISSAALLVAVFPANVQMALDAVAAAGRAGPERRRLGVAVAALVRLPLQWPLIHAAWAAGLPRG